MNMVNAYWKSGSEVKAFLSHNNLTNNQRTVVEFDGTVEYCYNNTKIQGQAYIAITMDGGCYDGSINIVGDCFDSQKVHVLFSPRYQKYKFDNNNNKLIVEGSSPKMGGNYRVSITYP